MTTAKPSPNASQWIALLDFRDRHGRTWKDQLSIKWMNGQDERERHSAHLRAIRNHFGPTWLHNLKADEIQRQRERFTLTLAYRTDAEVEAENAAAAASLAAEDGQEWAMTPEAQAPYMRRAGLALLAVLTIRRDQERGR
jgi:hypothetical protein